MAPRGQSEDPLSIMLLLQNYLQRDELERRLAPMQENIERNREEARGEYEAIRKDIQELKDKDLKELKDAILKKQEQSYKRTIAIQSGLLSPVVIGVILYIIQYIITPHH